MSAASCVERLMAAVTEYVKATLPGLLVSANDGQTIQAPAFRKIEKTPVLNAQYFPMVGINLDSVQFLDASTTSVEVDASIDFLVAATSTKPEELQTLLERYMDAVVDLGGYEASGALDGYEISVQSVDKGVEGDGSRGWAAITFKVVGEANL